MQDYANIYNILDNCLCIFFIFILRFIYPHDQIPLIVRIMVVNSLDTLSTDVIVTTTGPLVPNSRDKHEICYVVKVYLFLSIHPRQQSIHHQDNAN